MTTGVSACPQRSDLIAFQAGRLSALDQARIERHLGECPSCRQVVAELPPAPSALRPSPGEPTGTQAAADSGVKTVTGRPIGESVDVSFLDPPRGPDEIGWLGDYRILRVMGSGGMGIVFEAEDMNLHRRVAVKVLKPEIAVGPFRQRFFQEARLAASISHDNIVTIHQVSEHNGVPFLVMEYLHGESLEDRLKRDRWLPVAEGLRLARQVVEGLREAHARKLIHRDIKPANIWLETHPTSGAFRRVKILDFGLAKPLEGDTNLTTRGMVLGTPGYMAPEQVAGRPCDGRADLFSLGCVLLRMLTGMVPFEGPDTMAVLEATVEARIPLLEQFAPQVPRSVARLLSQLLARDPRDRIPSAQVLLDRIRDAEGSDTLMLKKLPGSSNRVKAVPHRLRRRVPIGVWAGGLTILAALVVGGVVFYNRLAGVNPDGSSTRQGTSTEKAAATRSLTTSPQPLTGGEPIRVGVLHSLTGTMFHSEEPVLESTRLAIEEVNKEGGILGRPLEAVEEDGASVPEVFARKAEKLITQDRVAVIFGCWTSSSRKAVKEMVEKHDHLLVYPLQDEGLETSPNILYMGALPNQQILPALGYAIGFLHRKRIFLVGSDYIYPRAANRIIRDEIETRHKGNVEIVGERYLLLHHPAKVPEVVREIVTAKPDLILNTINGPGNAVFFRELRVAGVKTEQVPTISFSIGETELRDLDVKQVVGDYAAWKYFMSLDSPANKEFVARFQARYGRQRVTTDPMQTAYFSVRFWAEAARAAKGVTASEVIRDRMKQMTYAAPEGEVKIDPETQHTWSVARIGQITEKGQFAIVNQGRPMAPQPYPGTRSRKEWQAFLDDLYRKWGQCWEAPGPTAIQRPD